MSGKFDVAMIARSQVGVSWNTNEGETQILEYFFASTNRRWSRQEAVQISWCSYFVCWVLLQAGIKPPPPTGNFFDTFSIARFFNDRTIVLPKGFAAVTGVYQGHGVGKYQPTAGDLYYKPHPHDHIGIVESVGTDGYLRLINGNGQQDEHLEWMMRDVPQIPKGTTAYGTGCVSWNKAKSKTFAEPGYAGMQFIEIPG